MGMRLLLRLSSYGSSVIPFDYQYLLASAIYHKLRQTNQPGLADMHESGRYKFFSVSNLLGGKIIAGPKGLSIENATVVISSPDANLASAIMDAMCQEPMIMISKTALRLVGIELAMKITLNKRERFVTLSPILVRTIREEDGKKKEWELYPTDGKFYENVHANLVRRYALFYGKAPEPDNFEITKIHWFKPKRIRVAGSYRRASLIEFSVTSTTELMEFCYYSGLGEKQAMGFGCIGRSDEINVIGNKESD